MATKLCSQQLDCSSLCTQVAMIKSRNKPAANPLTWNCDRLSSRFLWKLAFQANRSGKEPIQTIDFNKVDRHFHLFGNESQINHITFVSNGFQARDDKRGFTWYTCFIQRSVMTYIGHRRFYNLFQVWIRSCSMTPIFIHMFGSNEFFLFECLLFSSTNLSLTYPWAGSKSGGPSKSEIGMKSCLMVLLLGEGLLWDLAFYYFIEYKKPEMEKFSGEDSWTVNVHLALVLEPLVLRRLIRDFLFEKCATCQSYGRNFKWSPKSLNINKEALFLLKRSNSKRKMSSQMSS